MLIREYLESFEKYYYCNRQLFEEDTIKDCREILRQLEILGWNVENPLEFLEELIEWLRENKLYIELTSVRWAWFVIRKSRGLVKSNHQVDTQIKEEWYSEKTDLQGLLKKIKGEKDEG